MSLIAQNLTTNNQDYPSNSVLCKTSKKFSLEYAITQNGTMVAGDTVTLNIEFSDDNTNWYPYQNGPFGYLAEGQSTTPCNKSVDGDCAGLYIRVRLRTSYQNSNPSANYFTVTAKIILAGK